MDQPRTRHPGRAARTPVPDAALRLRGAVRAAAGPLLVAVALQSAGNLAFHAVLGRLLPSDGYGALGAVLAAMTMLGVPLGALQAATSTLAAGAGGGGLDRWAAARVLRSVGAWSVLPAAALALVTPAVAGYFHLATPLDAAALAPYLVVAALLAAARGLLLGAAAVPAVAATYLVGTGLRIGAGLGLAAWWGVGGALAGTLVGEAGALAVAGWPLLRPGSGGRCPAGAQVRLGLPAVARSAAAVTGLFLFSTVDLLLARHHLRAADSGGYVAAATVAKTVLALPAAVVSAVLPRLVAAWPSPHRGRALTMGAAAVVVPALAGAVVLVAVPGPMLRLLYGGGYQGYAGLVAALGAIAGLTSVVTVATYAGLARRAWSTALPWCGALVEVVLIEARHATPGDIATGSAGALVPTLVAMSLVEALAWRRSPDVSGPGPAPACR